MGRSSGQGKSKPSTLTGQRLVGARIRVWWPIDKKFYEGVVESYSSSNRKHRVSYDDGDIEYLVMGRQKWEVIEDDQDDEETSLDDEETSLDEDSSEGTPEPKKVKSNDKSSGKRKVEDVAVPKKRLKIDSAAVSSRTRSGKQMPKPSEKNGGKKVAAASLKVQRKTNGKVKQIPKDDDTSDEEEDSETLSSFMEKVKGKKEREDESSGTEAEEESSSSEAEDGDSASEENGSSGNESGEDSSGEDQSETESD